MEKLKSVLEKYVNNDVPIQSPYKEDLQRVVKHDKDDNEFVVYVPFVNSEVVEQNGSANAWKLNALLDAGVNPNFSIHTGYGTRVEGINALNSSVAEIESVLNEVSNEASSDES